MVLVLLRALEGNRSLVRLPHLVKPAFLILSLNGLSLAVDLCVRGYNAVRLGVCLHNLELHAPHAASDQECVVLQNQLIPMKKTTTDLGRERKRYIYIYIYIYTVWKLQVVDERTGGPTFLTGLYASRK